MRRTLILSLVALGLLLLAAYGVLQLSSARSFQLFGELVARVETDRPVVALTFDDGPTPDYTGPVLDLLAAHGVAATFFLTGREIEENPEEARAIVAAGHEIGNHSYSHPRMIFMSPDAVRAEIEATDAAIKSIGYEGPVHFRPPFGRKLVVLPWHLWRTGRTTIMWDLEPETWPEIAADAGAIAEHVIANATNGSIVILHVMYESRQTSREALPAIIEGLRARGFDFVTVSELLPER
ncbi:polysaccharide deacetylase [Arsenicitalea aurantiaca]|uniref:Chitooligosaccharide deacetylase n=1 Tax=Arsenicitalea aurantiaca TaxID=1783274 RepID=A0A433XBN1_9HYPH|nr:polysaccharide deacetylase family protein [Arsenicitalea aurantiaca]RUT31388.1 polysaccharide deacetylase [Arsenicitalea aurantiaca]